LRISGRSAALPGLGVILILVPIQYFVGVAIARARKNTLHAADKRVRLTEEVLRAIKLVKMYVWEEKFASGMYRKRERERDR
jgi:ATP-binding cassette subfamily C (CFTR/MRP) protein 8